MTPQSNVTIACGGTGGHIYPGIAIAQQLRDLGCDVRFIGNRGGMEHKLVSGEGFSIDEIKVQKILRGLSPQNLMVPLLLATATLKSRKILKHNGAKAVVCTGSFVSAPVALAAITLKIQLFFHESNSYPGLTTRWLARYTCLTFTAFEATAKYLPRVKISNIGIPLPRRATEQQTASLADLGLAADKPVILITGGSQGSLALNRAVSGALNEVLAMGYQLIWQTGRTGFAEFSARHKDVAGVHIFDFSPRLASYYTLARFAVTRAGALTLAELEQNRLPAILVPLPSAAENHQYLNAVEQQKRGLGLILEQKDLTPATLIAKIGELEAGHTDLIKHLELPPNTAARDIAVIVNNTISQGDKHAGKN